MERNILQVQLQLEKANPILNYLEKLQKCKSSLDSKFELKFR